MGLLGLRECDCKVASQIVKIMQRLVVCVVIHASAGVATSAQAMAWCMGDSLFVCVCSDALGIYSDPPSICGDSDLRCFIYCV